MCWLEQEIHQESTFEAQSTTEMSRSSLGKHQENLHLQKMICTATLLWHQLPSRDDRDRVKKEKCWREVAEALQQPGV